MAKKSLLEDTRVKLAVLWVFVMFNYVYADIMTLMDSSVLKDLIAGSVDGLQITPAFMLVGAFLMEIPIAMIVISLVLNYRWNKWVNIFAGAIKTLAVFGSLFVGKPALYYSFFAVIEIVTTSFIVWIAWRWKE